ncbi:hypothetical protein MC7420_6327 [Coleofasciculus chthonoplastes PCC 7420]|uniref:Uncharacterized protein n=1 Tax=Coleofasciculus chthonoplastes PCC 7420 TaxID=118168 RepID=B4VQU7_9CYAN|nr:hypothetical protein MC7420_6327 [Coleofasciculus chthonoplastes PCC 7420]
MIENSKRYYSDEYTRKAVDKVVSEQANSL